MGLKARMEQINKEYAMYANIKDTIVLNDGTKAPIEKLDTANVLTTILERKKILADMIAYGKQEESKEKEEELESRLKKNDAYFMGLDQEQKEEIKKNLKRRLRIWQKQKNGRTITWLIRHYRGWLCEI